MDLSEDFTVESKGYQLDGVTSDTTIHKGFGPLNPTLQPEWIRGGALLVYASHKKRRMLQEALTGTLKDFPGERGLYLWRAQTNLTPMVVIQFLDTAPQSIIDIMSFTDKAVEVRAAASSSHLPGLEVANADGTWSAPTFEQSIIHMSPTVARDTFEGIKLQGGAEVLTVAELISKVSTAPHMSFSPHFRRTRFYFPHPTPQL